jgi:hypothetical protein
MVADTTSDGIRLFAGDELEGGRIALLPDGRCFAYPSPWVDVAPLRKGRRKVKLPDWALLLVHALELSMSAEAAALREVSPAASVLEAHCHLKIAREAEKVAADARARAVTLLEGPIEAAACLQTFSNWVDEILLSHGSFEIQQATEVALRIASEAVRSDAACGLIIAIEKLTSEKQRPPLRSELRTFLGLDNSEKDREFRRTLKRLGFEWLPLGVGGRPRKS